APPDRPARSRPARGTDRAASRAPARRRPPTGRISRGAGRRAPRPRARERSARSRPPSPPPPFSRGTRPRLADSFLEDRHLPDRVALLDLVDDVEPARHLPEHGVEVVEVRERRARDVELR